MANDPASNGVTDITSQTADISYYWFLADQAGTTVEGFFIDKYQKRIGASFSTNLTTATGMAPGTQLAATIPGDAIGAIVRFSGKTYFDLNTAADLDFTVHATANYPFFGTSDGNVPISRVNQV